MSDQVPPPPPPPPPPGGMPPVPPPPGGAYGIPYGAGAPGPVDASKKVPAGVCGILLGSLGIHKFILGYTKEGLIMLLVTIFTCGIAGIVFGIIGLIEGIVYLTKTDQEFYDTYVVGHKGWF